MQQQFMLYVYLASALFVAVYSIRTSFITQVENGIIAKAEADYGSAGKKINKRKVHLCAVLALILFVTAPVVNSFYALLCLAHIGITWRNQ